MLTANLFADQIQTFVDDKHVGAGQWGWWRWATAGYIDARPVFTRARLSKNVANERQRLLKLRHEHQDGLTIR
jgi:hypothetical protein